MQITTPEFDCLGMQGCYLWCKDTNFNANHNGNRTSKASTSVVIYGAKILILMQITTRHGECPCSHHVVIYGAKILILMQITTCRERGRL